MLILKPASGLRRTGNVGQALAGGGPLGTIYELGALRAVDDALVGMDLNHFPAGFRIP